MAESLIYDLCKAVGSKLLEEGRLLIGVPEEALEMRRKLKRIEVVLKAAEQREVEADVKEWIRELKNVAYDIEDVLDDWSIAQLEVRDKSISLGCLSRIPLSPCFCFKRHHIAHTIRKINKELDGIYVGTQRINLQRAILGTSEGPKREAITTSYEYYDDVVSQKILKAKLIKQLVDSDLNRSVADRIPIISIVGMGGLGKTTVARLVYDDETLKNHFSHKIAWVCVSNNFDAMKVAKDIFRELTGKPAEESALQSLLTRIENSIRGTKFFLVLDDVWETSEKKWNPILKCLSKGDAQGSRILMTSRDSNFSPIMRVDIVPMNKLSEAEAMSLFSYYAFPEDPDHRGEVEDIAVQLVEKCGGLPLALQVLGRYMADKTTRSQWNDVLSSEMWKMKFQDEVFNSLAFSYLELRSEAKRCFAFCSVFPKDTVMMKNQLIRLWMAQGYLQGADQKEVLREEVLGEECFESLLRRLFFRVSKSYSSEYEDIGVTMHDLVHDFAQYISNDDVAILDPSDVKKGSANLRHLAFTRKITESECPLSSLSCSGPRTLFVRTHKSAPVLDELCSNKSYIRALSMNIYSKSETFDGYDIKDIGKLIHLRYIRLSLTKFTVLPEEICRLPYLQTLDVSKCVYLKKLPKDIGCLTMLRHLLFHGGKMNSLPKGLGKLSSLRTLSSFICGGLANEDCSSLEDLRDLNNLRGDLTLRNLNSVANVDEATRASLSKKTHIRQLELHFGEGDASLQSEVLKALQLAKENLVFLKISEYRGKLCPPWTGQMQYLKKVQLEGVGMESLPKLGTLSFLEYLMVKDANEVRHVGVEFFGKVKEGQLFFPKLESLHFEYMANWEHWDAPEEIMRSGVTVMPSLRSLKMYKCEALQTLPRFLEHVPLESFKVDSCHLPPVDVAEDDHPKRWHMGDILLPQTLKIIETPYVTLRHEEAPFQPEASSQVVQQQHLNFNCVEIRSPGVPRWIMDLSYLRKVKLSRLDDVRLPPLGSLAYLEELTIWGAEKVEKVGDEFLGDHTEVRHVGAEIFGKVKEGQSFFPKLESLYFENMANWERWDDPEEIMRSGVTVMPSLRSLRILECKALQTLPHFLEHVPLETFKVDSCLLPPVVLAEDDYLKWWRIGDILLPQTLKIIGTPYVTLRQEEAPFQPEASQVVQQQHLNFNCVQIGSYYVLSTVTVPRWIMDFAYLRKVKLFKLEDVWLPPLGSLACLEKLTIGNAEKVEKLGDEFLGISSSNNNKDGDHGGRGASTTPFIAFPKLKELSFEGMPAWREWEDPIHGNNLIIMPSLCELSIRRCEKLKSLPHFFEALVSLKTLEVGATAEGNLPKIRNTTTNTGEDEAAYEMSKARSTTTTPAQLELREITLFGVKNEWLRGWEKYCGRLRKLGLVGCAEASYVGQLEVSLSSLETLYVSARDFRGTGMELLSISSLKKLYLQNIYEWEQWDDAPPHQPEVISDESRELSQHGNNTNFTSNLRALYLHACPKLKALPSFLRSVCTLEQLCINNCDALRRWWENEAGEDWLKWISAIPSVFFPPYFSGTFRRPLDMV